MSKPTPKQRSSFWERNLTLFRRQTVAGVARAWEEIEDTARAIRGKVNPDLPKSDTERVLQQMQA